MDPGLAVPHLAAARLGDRSRYLPEWVLWAGVPLPYQAGCCCAPFFVLAGLGGWGVGGADGCAAACWVPLAGIVVFRSAAPHTPGPTSPCTRPPCRRQDGPEGSRSDRPPRPQGP